MCDETVWDSKTICHLPLDPLHFCSLLELVNLCHSRGVVLNFLDESRALIKKPHQRVVHCVVKLLIWVKTKEKVALKMCQTIRIIQ